MQIEQNELSIFIREIRQNKNLTLKQFANKLDISKPQLIRIEKQCTPNQFFKICQACKYKVSFLVY